jgi:hypothetical protein
VDTLLRYEDNIQWLETPEKLEKYEAEVREFLSSCKSPRFLKDNGKDFWEGLFTKKFEERREELAAEKARAELPRREEPSTNKPRSGSLADLWDYYDPIGKPKPSRPTDDSANGIKKMLERFRETDEDTPPDPPNGKTP